MADKRYYEERRNERQDGSMLNEDKSAVANMPQDVKYHGWPGNEVYLDGDLDDTIRGINKQIGEDVSGTKRHLKNNKW